MANKKPVKLCRTKNCQEIRYLGYWCLQHWVKNKRSKTAFSKSSRFRKVL